MKEVRLNMYLYHLYYLYLYTVPSSPMYATIHSVTNVSAVVDWSRPANPNGVIEGYRLYFLHGNYTDVKTIKSRDPRVDYVLTDLAPATVYYVWIKAFTWKAEGVSSSRLSIRTDVEEPGEPATRTASHWMRMRQSRGRRLG